MAKKDSQGDLERESEGAGHGLTRRSLFRSAGVAAAAGALLRRGRALAQEAAEDGGSIGPGPTPVRIRVNGEERVLRVEPRRTLLDALRTDLDLTGTKQACDRGTCGACTVWLDGEPVYSCMTLAVEADGRDVTTVEGLAAADGTLHPVQQAFVEQDALQCGFCTPGLVMSCAWSVRMRGSATSPETLRHDLCGNLCRCGTYPHVIQAGLLAAGAPRAGGGPPMHPDPPPPPPPGEEPPPPPPPPPGEGGDR